MPTIDQLSSTTTVNAGDKVPVYVQSNGDARSATMQVLLDFVEANFASPDYVTQIFAPSSSGTSIQFVPQTANLWAIINPTGAFAALTLVLPPSVGALYADGSQILVTSTNSVAVLTVNGNGATVVGAPTALLVGGFFTLRYNKLQNTWYTVSQSLGSTGSVFTSLFDVNGNIIFSMQPNYTPPGTDVVYVEVQNRSSGSPPKISPNGPPTDISLTVSSKNAGLLSLSAPSGDVGITAGDAITLDSASTAISGTLGVTINGQKLTVQPPIDNTDGGILIRGRTFAQLANLISVLGNVAGIHAYCTDSNTVVFNATVAGGGANKVPVTYDGTNWKVG